MLRPNIPLASGVPMLPKKQTRRLFVKAGAVLTTGGLLSTQCRSSLADAKFPKFRVGIIGRTGKGDYGHGVDVAFTKLPNVEIVALADENEAGRIAAANRTNPKKTYADYREMFSQEKLDVVAICPRWIDQHHEMILAAADVGCHVYMEKPFCPTLADCDSAIQALEKKKFQGGEIGYPDIIWFGQVCTSLAQHLSREVLKVLRVGLFQPNSRESL